MKNSSDPVGNGTRDLPACSTMSKATAPPRAFIRAPLKETQLRTLFKAAVISYLPLISFGLPDCSNSG
jgi:hypothetical protein